MSQSSNKYRFLFAGGGTGGHLFPAVAVAQKIMSIKPEAEIMFIGTKSKIEGKIVPKLGFNFKSIWVSGFSRKVTLKNILFPLKLFVSLMQSIIINMKFKPKVAIGSGGYVSGPAIYASDIMGAKIILLEQNIYPGVTNRLLEKYAREIHLSFEESKKYFKQNEKLKYTGNPVRDNLQRIDRTEALKSFNLSPDKKTLLVLGGSLGAASLNKAVSDNLIKFYNKGIQLIWQTGKNYIDEFKKYSSENFKILSFVDNMSLAYSACDIVVSRAGGITIAEILKLGVPAILVPSPNVAENHQYLNAKNLFDNAAVLLIEDSKLSSELWNVIETLIFDDIKLNDLSSKALTMAKPEAATVVAESAIKLAEE
ncbi:MAG: undecaprenyldiphospho-muramoylpentapeptide beta-N-acetylglucosaminyltransferase [Bacteroidetes bacterium]|nr:undecaprenyldiphospho-muramoylpentapeptide beta-N-acetylglucosaminyltransferase [Bacteroidota bacterium]